MIAFAALLERLVFTPSRNAKIALLRQYFATQPDPDRGIGLAAITGELSFTTAKPGLIRELAALSPRFVELWEGGNLEPHQDHGRHKTIDHPAVGRITLDCDTLVVAADDLRIMIFTAEPGTEDAERLTLATVLGTQALID